MMRRLKGPSCQWSSEAHADERAVGSTIGGGSDSGILTTWAGFYGECHGQQNERDNLIECTKSIDGLPPIRIASIYNIAYS